ncbi:unnamed protein product [Rangifer tarandus platyrhynchus]|uniref:Nuclear cap-binding protein subunit 3 n=1 Tax=Rangifer tarandus platyrhynchus TaxID=3082113 RepID=A0ABN8YU06_RANTA|nr:unnamed protein product [Rangifer tarandus platyrhynchus]
MAAVRGLRVSVKAEAPAGPALGLPSPEAGLDRGEPEPMEVEEGELEVVQVRRSLKELIPFYQFDTSRRYENKAGSFIIGIDVTSKEAIEKKEQRAKRFHFRSEVNLTQRNVALDRDMMKKAIPKVRLETIYICGVDEMSTQDVFKEYPPAHMEWLDDTSCNVVWLDEMTAARALINMSSLPALDKIRSKDANEDKSSEKSKKDKQKTVLMMMRLKKEKLKRRTQVM